MVSNFIQSEDAVSNIRQASVYVDACFILSFLDEDDKRSDKVASLIDAWREKDVRMGISTHTFAEVVGVLTKNMVERSLNIYMDNLECIESEEGLSCLVEDDRRDIISIKAARNLYRIYQYIIRKRQESGNTNKEIFAKELLKVGKGHDKRRELLGEYYIHSVQVFEEFLYSMEEYFDIQIEILAADYDTMIAASQYITLYQLESYDAMHLALARNKYDFFVTLDKDFIQDFPKKDEQLTTKVIFVA